MANSKQHIKISLIGGGIIAAIVDITDQLNYQALNPGYKFNFIRLLKRTTVGALGGLAASTLPDILEPAKQILIIEGFSIV